MPTYSKTCSKTTPAKLVLPTSSSRLPRLPILVFLLLLAALVNPSGSASGAQPQSPTHYKGRKIAQTMHWSGAEWLLRQSRGREENVTKLMDALDVKAGQTVCDLGCGNGYHTLRLAERVGPTGKILAVDIQQPMLDELEERRRLAKLNNIETILGGLRDPKLPPESCDLILLVDVYHEFGDPEIMLQKMRRALKPNGRIALVEFRGEDPKVPIKPLHKMTKKQILLEFPPSGYRLVGEYDELPWQHLMFFARDQRRVLFLGNSYTAYNNLPSMIARLGRDDPNPCDIVGTAVTPGGCTLEQHAASLNVAMLLAGHKWDRVVLQEQSMRPIVAPDRMLTAAKRLLPGITKSGARPLLYATWSREATPGTFDALAKAYHDTARAVNGDEAPVGKAFAHVRRAHPKIKLYADDGSHPSLAGSYLAACILYARIADRDPRQCGNAGTVVPAETARILRDAAWAVVREAVPKER